MQLIDHLVGLRRQGLGGQPHQPAERHEQSERDDEKRQPTPQACCSAAEAREAPQQNRHERASEQEQQQIRGIRHQQQHDEHRNDDARRDQNATGENYPVRPCVASSVMRRTMVVGWRLALYG